MAVVGAGPAGCAAAIILAGHGASVVVFEATAYDGPRIGETLPPEVRLPLDRLGAWDRFEAAGHLASPGILAAWGQAEPYANDFILNPHGPGWRVDRNRFDAMLADRAAEAGAVVQTGTAVRACLRTGDGRWELAATRGGAPSRISARFLVDATGRASAFGRGLGARRVVHDRMVALVGFVAQAAGTTEDRRALIEATETGWWYSGLLPGGGMVLAFHTDAGPGLRTRWAGALALADRTAARTGGGGLVGAVRVVPAGSHRADPVAGDGWLAAGAAAAAHDPVCGRGVHWALESGIAGAEAVVAGAGAAAYAGEMGARFDRYLAVRSHYYRAEARWPDAPFWQRRRGP